MRILITGSTGFVGKHLLPLLKGAGYEVIHLVRSSKGFDNEIVWDFKSSLTELPICDAIIHLAAQIDFGADHNFEQYQVNTVATMKLAKFAQSCNAYFIFASTIGVHGNNFEHISQSTPLNPDNIYSTSKYLAEEIIKTFVSKYNILRIAGIYGLDGPVHLGLNVAIGNAIHKKIPPTLKGSGQARRNYICVRDVARWILHLVQQFETQKGSLQETTYIAGSEILNIKQYLQTIVGILLLGQKLRQIEGSETEDCVVNFSPHPFELTSFERYLYSLANG